ncbi:Thioesterase/thiol ester dehydrase-isomerase [Pseudovirgaria hyperparasitica]|uniref:Thioesterase/thiol ester dehydrase-isomerase n=1 Tax=Pseudovirgaria hyperparasitica TaxID=470096 RepID=A0A6A6WEU3_9PEZI|nr:Thioesterase/thiol ester dehydrase-isomerase [Pseudovirgaria hyperparasitica]KAF2761348.1 Thioesterase/thiol ester dehydrase-isomerase [Pseudovirgaria hyperparasitica]
MAPDPEKNFGVGFVHPEVPVSWLKRDLLLFANSIGATEDELHFLYELHPSFAAFPTYPIILPFKHTDTDVIDFYARNSSTPIPGVPKFDSKRVVDGERKIILLHPIPLSSAGRTFVSRTIVLGVYDKGAPGSVVETETQLLEKLPGGDEKVYSKVIGSAFFVKQGGWGGPKGPKGVNYPPPEGKKADVSFSHATTKTSALLYRLNGDYNPLHASPEAGAKMGFGGAIMHGLYSWNTTCHGILKALGGSDPANMREFAARFASPVLPGDVLETDVWVLDGEGEWREVRFVTKVKGGKVCLSNGRAMVRLVAGKKESKL